MGRSVRQWIEAFDSGEFGVEGERPSVYSYEYDDYARNCRDVACDAGWYDWFCKDTALIGRIRRYAPLIKSLAKANPAIMDSCKVSFTQRLGWGGFCDCVHIYTEDDAGWGVYVANPNRDHRYEVFRYGTLEGTDFVCDSVRDLRAWFAQETVCRGR